MEHPKVNSVEAILSHPAKLPLVWIAVMLGVMVPLVCYVGLPAIGVYQFALLFSFKRFLMLMIGMGGMVAYVGYFRWVTRQPQWLMYFIAFLWPVVEISNQWLLYFGLNIHLRLLIVTGLFLPGLWLGWQHRRTLLSRVPHLPLLIAFLSWLLLYFVFFNAHAVDQMVGLTGKVGGENSVDMIQFTAYISALVTIIVTAVTVLTHPEAERFFDRFNTLLLIVCTLESLVTVAGYPFGFLRMELDGFNRSYGIFTHPNPFSHHMGIVLTYLLGLYFYYQGERKKRIPHGLMLAGFAINLLAFLMGLSKTGIAVFIGSAFVIMMLNGGSAEARHSMFKAMIVFLVVIPVGLVLFQWITDQNFMELLQARVEQQQSFNWRKLVWEDLRANINVGSVLFGHGFTASNAWIFQLTYNNQHNATPLIMVHNGYLALLYDLGLMGWLFFMAVGAVVVQSIKKFYQKPFLSYRPLFATIVGLAAYFSVVCAFDEMTYMFDAAMLFWMFVTMTYLQPSRLEDVA